MVKLIPPTLNSVPGLSVHVLLPADLFFAAALEADRSGDRNVSGAHGGHFLAVDLDEQALASALTCAPLLTCASRVIPF